MPEPSPQPVVPPRLDAAATARLRRRIQTAPTPPWLHDEAARRMAERIAYIKQPPRRVLDWSLQPADPLQALRAACGGAELSRCWPEGLPLPARSWWSDWWRRGDGGGRPVAAAELPAGQADLLWSNMWLHLEVDPPQLFKAWRQAVASDGFVMFSTLGPGSFGLLRQLYAEQGWGPAHGPLVDMHDLGDMLVEAGFADPVMDQETLRLTYTDPARLLAELRSLGANLAPDRHPGCRGRRWHETLHEQLKARADAQGRIVLEVELVYGHAFRAPDRGPAVAAETSIGLDDMKLMLRKSESRK